MASPDVAQCFSDLDKAFQAGEFDKAVAACEKILAASPDDIDAAKSMVVCLIQDGKIDDALAALTKYKGKISADFEHAYVLYRLNRCEEGLALLNKLGSGPGVEDLKAQTLYKMGEYDKAAVILDKVLASDPSNFEHKTNVLAAYSLSSTPKKGLDLLSGKDASSTYEIIYNRACILIEMGRWDEAEVLLEQALTKCRENCKAQGMTEEETADELACVVIQKAFVHQMQGNEDQAMNEYIEAVKMDTSDVAALAVANNNIVTLKKDKDLFDSQKRIKSAVDAKTEAKLTKKQRAAVHLNRCLMSLHMNKGEACREQAAAIAEQYPQSDVPALIMASMFWKEKKGSKVEETLKTYAAQHPEHAMRAVLSLAQIQFQSNKVKDAVATLRSVESIQYKPAVVATLLKMCTACGEIDVAVAALNDAVQWWSTKADASDEKQMAMQKTILREAASFKSKHGLHGEALKEYKSLVLMDRYDYKALTGLIVASAITEPNLAEQYEAKLPEVEGLKTADGEALENASMATTERRSNTRKRDVSEGGDAMEIEKKKKRKKRKTVLPKSVDPNNLPPLDSERWLPLRERTYFKAKKGKKGANAMRGSQGASAAMAANANNNTKKQSAAEEEAARLAASKQAKAAESSSQPRNKKKGRR